MICGCIDIGSNTTRLLVAEPADGRLRELLRQRAFTRIGKGLRARRHDPGEEDRARSPRSSRPRCASRASSAPRRSARSPRRRSARPPTRRSSRARSPTRAGVDGRGPQRRGGGAARVRRRDQRARPPARRGHRRDRRRRLLVGDRDRHDRRRRARVELVPRSARASSPTPTCTRTRRAIEELQRVRAHVGGVFEGFVLPTPELAVAVGGSSTSLRRLVGGVLDHETLERGLRILATHAQRGGRAGVRDRGRARAPAARRHARPRGDLRPPRAPAGDRARRPARGRDPRDADRAPGGARVTSRAARRAAYGEAAEAVIAARVEAVFAHERERVLDLADIEGVHQMRVATRRLRAALEVFAPAFAAQARRTRAAPRSRRSPAALGERRDRDVQLELLESLRERCTAARAPGGRRAARGAAPRAAAARTTQLASALEHAKRRAAATATARGSRDEGAARRWSRARRCRSPRQRGGSSRCAPPSSTRFVPEALDERNATAPCTTCGSPPSACATCSSWSASASARSATRRKRARASCRRCSARSTTAT